MSSWLLDAAAAGAAGGGAGGGGAAFLSAAALAAELFDGGMSAIAGLGGGAAGFGGAAGLAGFSAAGDLASAADGLASPPGGLLSPAGGLASSSAMIRRIDARISSIEGSWTFAGCVISNSKSSTPSHALFYTKHDGIGRFRLYGLCDFVAGRTCPQISTARIDAQLRPARGIEASWLRTARAPRIA